MLYYTQTCKNMLDLKIPTNIFLSLITDITYIIVKTVNVFTNVKFTAETFKFGLNKAVDLIYFGGTILSK